MPPATGDAEFYTVDVFGKSIEESFPAKVVGVTDGDTIKILDDQNNQIGVRLESIDTPEKKQAYGTKAKQALSDLVFGKQVTIQKTGQDRYGRTLAFVVADGINTSQALIEGGYAWHYKQYSDDPELAELEEQTGAAKRGLWADAEPVPPWKFRKH